MRLYIFKIVFWVLILSVLPFEGVTQDYKTDNAEITVVKPDHEKLEKYRKNPNFDYDKVYKKQRNWIERVLFYLWKMLEKLLSNYQFFNIVFYIIIIGLIMFLILKISGYDVKNIFAKKQTLLPEYIIHNVDIFNTNLEEELTRAIADKDWQLAVRYRFLIVLKQLYLNKKIILHTSKTNSDYANDLKDTEIRHDFSVLSRIYDYVWYGDRQINENTYNIIENYFNNFEKKII